MIYRGWPDVLLKAEREFYDRFEPRLWLRAANQFQKEADLPTIRGQHQSGEFTQFSKAEVKTLHSDFSGTRNLFLRQFRYQSSETLMLLIIAAQNRIPYAKAAKSINGSRLNSMFVDISNNRTPVGLELLFEGKEIDFKSWLNYKITGSLDPHIDQSVFEFIVQEARLLSDRQTINAIKHGRASVDIGNNHLKFDIVGDEKDLTLFDGPVISFDCWEEVKSQDRMEVAYFRAFESANPEDDYRAIFAASLLMGGIKEAREQMLGKPEGEVTFPINIKPDTKFFRVRGAIK